MKGNLAVSALDFYFDLASLAELGDVGRGIKYPQSPPAEGFERRRMVGP